MQQTSDNFIAAATEALHNDYQQATRDFLGQMAPKATAAARANFGDWDALRAHVKRIREHSLDHLAYYLEQYEAAAQADGVQVHWAEDADALNRRVLEICREHGARRVAKGKSMVTEETGLTPYLESAGLTVTETDLGEYIVQQAGEPPSHIVGPALHKSVDEVRELFLRKHDLGERALDGPPELVAEARTVLRDTFLQADVGIIGANALIAESGHSMLVTNEGNGDLVANLPAVRIVCTTIDRVVPRAEDATAMLRLLVRSATGQSVTAYTSFYGGSRREEEQDGPTETHVILLDNHRGEMLEGPFRDMLHCIRCGNCLTHCPIYVAAGGHAYGWVYPGPMGSVLTPLLTSLEASSALPNACTACGRCAEICPADIPLPDLLRDLREEESQQRLNPRRWRLGIRWHARLLRFPRLYHGLSRIAIAALHRLGRRRGAFQSLWLAEGWTGQRDFPAPQSSTTFMQEYRQQSRQSLHSQKAQHDGE